MIWKGLLSVDPSILMKCDCIYIDRYTVVIGHRYIKVRHKPHLGTATPNFRLRIFCALTE